jgi:hypothetical protein
MLRLFVRYRQRNVRKTTLYCRFYCREQGDVPTRAKTAFITEKFIVLERLFIGTPSTATTAAHSIDVVNSLPASVTDGLWFRSEI